MMFTPSGATPSHTILTIYKHKISFHVSHYSKMKLVYTVEFLTITKKNRNVFRTTLHIIAINTLRLRMKCLCMFYSVAIMVSLYIVHCAAETISKYSFFARTIFMYAHLRERREKDGEHPPTTAQMSRNFWIFSMNLHASTYTHPLTHMPAAL